MGRSVSEAAAQAVEKSNKKAKAERKDEDIIPNLRNLLNAHLAVPPDDVRYLLAQYDILVANNEVIKAAIAAEYEKAQAEVKQRLYDEEESAKVGREVLRNAIQEIDRSETTTIYTVPENIGETVEVPVGVEVHTYDPELRKAFAIIEEAQAEAERTSGMNEKIIGEQNAKEGE